MSGLLHNSTIQSEEYRIFKQHHLIYWPGSCKSPSPNHSFFQSRNHYLPLFQKMFLSDDMWTLISTIYCLILSMLAHLRRALLACQAVVAWLNNLLVLVLSYLLLTSVNIVTLQSVSQVCLSRPKIPLDLTRILPQHHASLTSWKNCVGECCIRIEHTSILHHKILLFFVVVDWFSVLKRGLSVTLSVNGSKSKDQNMCFDECGGDDIKGCH